MFFRCSPQRIRSSAAVQGDAHPTTVNRRVGNVLDALEISVDERCAAPAKTMTTISCMSAAVRVAAGDGHPPHDRRSTRHHRRITRRPDPHTPAMMRCAPDGAVAFTWFQGVF
jgi:hypothetical protein